MYSHPFSRETKIVGRYFVSGHFKWNKDSSLLKPQRVALNGIYGLVYFLKIWMVFYRNMLLNLIKFTTVMKLA